ncbi:MAG: PD40 domain-containing protein [Myxococcales bacterium]|nr:PD40 domain-containing protein [Myxococcales bacterium]
MMRASNAAVSTRWFGALAVASALVGCSAETVGGADGGRRDGAAMDGFVPERGERVVFGPGTDSSIVERFRPPPVSDATRAARILYPLDEVMFPRNVWAPHVQWEGAGAMGDVFRLSIRGGPVTLVAYVLHTGAGFTNAFALPQPEWNAVTLNAPGQELALTVDRWERTTNQVISGQRVRMRIARGSIAGAVYYWALGEFGGTEGRILRLIQGGERAPAPDNFMPNPPPRTNGERCAACHMLSRDGNRLAVSFGDGDFGGVVDATRDLRGPEAPVVFRFDRSWFYSSFSPNGRRLWMTDAMQQSQLLDANTGAVVTPASGPLRNGTHPAWAPDNSSVVLVVNANDAWNLNVGDLARIPVAGDDRFGAAGALHTGASLMGAPEGGAMDAYPTWSPDSRWIAFQHGRGVVASRADASGALYLVAPAGGAPVRLDRASEGRTPGDAFYPNFTPFVTEGMDPSVDGAGEFRSVYWLLFYARRDYGNAQVGTRGTGRRQIWVSAISTDVRSGRDASAVPYWLPGQEVAQQNASALWAPLACRQSDADCQDNGECCSGNCFSGRCLPPGGSPDSGGACRREGQSCGTSADCCDRSLTCVGSICVSMPL